MDIKARLFELQDPGYKAFHARLIPTVEPSTIIGVRVPVLRAFAKTLGREADAFLAELPHRYYEENNLHAFLIAETADFERCLEQVEAFLPYIDNWATCDGLRPKCFRKERGRLLPAIRRWLQSEHPYTVRFAIEMLMVHYLDEAFEPEYLRLVAAVRSEHYYVKMMVAWYFATALAKQWEQTLPYLAELSDWERRKTIQKAVESDRITEEQKDYLKGAKKNGDQSDLSQGIKY